MGRTYRPWQATEYVLALFGKTVGRARKTYADYVEAGVTQGRRDDLIGGGLIRSLGGWAAVTDRRKMVSKLFKSDERILGASDFVEAILAQANERYTCRTTWTRQEWVSIR